MTPPQRQQDNDRVVAGTPAPARAPQQRAADNRAAAKIDAAEFWRRLGL
ncbi:MAG: hypothetical protein ABW169_16575 [Sphingobium sp.]